MSVGEKEMLNLVILAVADGDMKAIKAIVEMLEGKPAQPLSLAGNVSRPARSCRGPQDGAN